HQRPVDPSLFSTDQRVPATVALPAGPACMSEVPAPTNHNPDDKTEPASTDMSGAIEALAVNPGDPKVIYVGAVNGGVWKTTEGADAFPTWKPLTDQLPSLSIAALQFDPTDATNQTLVAGIGR